MEGATRSGTNQVHGSAFEYLRNDFFNAADPFTGIDAPYEPPEDPEIVVRTDKETVDESIATILEQLLPRLKANELDE